MFNETENSWSVQTIKNEDYTVAKADGTVQEEHRCVLKVCTEGQDLFKQHVIKDDDERILAFDFLALAGDVCANSKFYELEYTVGGKYGVVSRALFQLSDPAAEIRAALAALRRVGLLPLDLVPHKLYLRDDIDVVKVGKFFIAESGSPTFWATQFRHTDSTVNAEGRKTTTAYVYYGDKGNHAVYALDQDTDNFPKVFVAGDSSVFDPEFAEQRDRDLADMLDHINEASQLAAEYGLNHLFLYDLPVFLEGSDAPKMHLSAEGSYDVSWLSGILRKDMEHAKKRQAAATHTVEAEREARLIKEYEARQAAKAEEMSRLVAEDKADHNKPSITPTE